MTDTYEVILLFFLVCVSRRLDLLFVCEGNLLVKLPMCSKGGKSDKMATGFEPGASHLPDLT